MNKFKLILLWSCLVLGGQPAIAAANSYQCVIAEQQMLENNGTLKRPPQPYLIGKRFAVDRNTGHIVGPEQALWQLEDHKVTVVARGNKDNSFIVVSVGPARGDGVHATMLQVEEFTESKSKPFIVLSGSQVTSGVCE